MKNSPGHIQYLYLSALSPFLSAKLDEQAVPDLHQVLEESHKTANCISENKLLTDILSSSDRLSSSLF